jgi:hypothetical protein
MRVQQPVRDRNMSLWQSAVRQALANRGDLNDAEKRQAGYGISLRAQSEQTATPLAAPAATATATAQVGGKSPLGSAANHGFAIFDVAPDKITASYYEYPTWGQRKAPPSDPPIDNYIYQETLLPMR